jgi:hypothetical protein
MEAVDDHHQRPGGDVLDLEDEDSCLPPAQAGALKEDGGGGAVRQMQGRSDRAPVRA